MGYVFIYSPCALEDPRKSNLCSMRQDYNVCGGGVGGGVSRRPDERANSYQVEARCHEPPVNT